MDELKHFYDYESCLKHVNRSKDARVAAVKTHGLHMEWTDGKPSSSGYWTFRDPHDIDYLLIFHVISKQPAQLWFGKVTDLATRISSETGKKSIRFNLQEVELVGVTVQLWKKFTANFQSNGTRILQQGTKFVDDDNESDIPPTGYPTPNKIMVEREVWQCSDAVKDFALKRAKGKCQGCEDESLPLYTDEGHVFLEVHHVIYLSDGGPDTPDNTTALCPRCHKNAHFGHDRNVFRESLYRRHLFLTRY